MRESMNIVLLGAPSRDNVHIASSLCARLIGLVAAGMLLGACQGSSSSQTNLSYWHHWYGDPDTGRPCCGSNN
jgi:hypothetical protein